MNHGSNDREPGAGNGTGRTAGDEEPRRVFGPEADQDPLSYAAYRRRRALWLPTGFALMLAGCAVSSAATLLPAVNTADGLAVAAALDKVVSVATKDLVTTSFTERHVLATLLLIAFVAAGIALLRRAADDDHAFKRAHPHLEITVGDDQLAMALSIRRRCLAVGAVLLAAAVAVNVALDGAVNDAGMLAADLEGTADMSQMTALPMTLVYLLAAAGTWFAVHGSVAGSSASIEVYNYRALQSVSPYEIDVNQTGALRARMLAEKRVQERHAKTNRAIVAAGVTASLAMYFLPTFETPFYWTGLLAAGLGCLWVDHRALVRAERAREQALREAA